ncbi:hypothetical protein [Reyranella sp.]|uniref:hypothetical protein n=1 Tax=Reyranella sp. TaxID=1929291 RepID=UPI003BAD2371
MLGQGTAQQEEERHQPLQVRGRDGEGGTPAIMAEQGEHHGVVLREQFAGDLCGLAKIDPWLSVPHHPRASS